MLEQLWFATRQSSSIALAIWSQLFLVKVKLEKCWNSRKASFRIALGVHNTKAKLFLLGKSEVRKVLEQFWGYKKEGLLGLAPAKLPIFLFYNSR